MPTEQNLQESGKLAQGAKWVIRQLLLELENRRTPIELYDAEPNGHVIYYRLISGQEAVVADFAQRLSIQKTGNRLEVQHGK